MKKRLFLHATIGLVYCFNFSTVSCNRKEIQNIQARRDKILQKMKRDVASIYNKMEMTKQKRQTIPDIPHQICIETKKIASKKIKSEDCQEAKRDWAIAIKNGYFYPQDKTLRAIFDCRGNKGGYWFEGAVRYNFWKGMNVEASGSYFKKEGKALCSNECTQVSMPTCAFVLKYFFDCANGCECSKFSDKASFFVGGGLRLFFYKEKNNFLFVKQCLKEKRVGGTINLGFSCTFCKKYFIDLFFDYNFKTLKDCYNVCCDNTYGIYCCPSSFCKLDLGGAVVGIGLGCSFK